MKLLVIDDEKIVLDSVVHMLGQNFPEVEVETARNGKEGLIKLESFRPELVLTDIRMPGMSGLDFIREARRTNETVHIVIVTAFDQFDYAKEAFKYRVEDYILKPLTKQKLVDVVQRALNAIKVNKDKRYQELESIDRLYRAMQMVENNFFFGLLQWGDLAFPLDTYRDLLSLPLEAGFLIGAQAMPLPKEATWKQTNAYFNRLGDACSALRDRLKFSGGGLVSDPMGLRFYAYVEPMAQDVLLSLLEIAYQDCLKRHSIKVKFVYSGLVPNTQWSSTLSRINEALPLSERNVDALSLIAPSMTTTKHPVQERTGGHDRQEDKPQPGLGSPEASGPYKLALECSEYLKAHMVEPVSLEGMANRMHVTAPYLSKVFKDQLGTTFSEYLTTLRIDAAKALLRQGGMSIKDVGAEVGYLDPNYFVRLFKKVTGYTPSEYQRVMEP